MLGLLIFIAIICIFLASLYFKQKKLANSLPPGPPALPIFGNILQVDKNDIRKTFIEWHKTYGPIFTVWMGITPQIYVTGYDAMNEIFVKHGDQFVDRPPTYGLELFMNGK